MEDGVSEKLQRSGILSYRVFWFEKEPPSTYPELALSAISTHDLPTIAGMWTRSDIEAAQDRSQARRGSHREKQKANGRPGWSVPWAHPSSRL